MIKSTIRKFLPGVSWQNPVINTVFKLIDPFDLIARKFNGNSQIPPYSIRVRSAGVDNQFGGSEFLSVGKTISGLLRNNLNLTKESKVLEIGCGSGRTAFILAEELNQGNFYGMDIEQVALNACLTNSYLQSKNFTFQLMDVQNDEFNPNGKFSADSFEFPYSENTFDVIYLVSVFTHMMTDDVSNYIKEISRMLKPGGSVMVTTFLIDTENDKDLSHFPHKFESAFCRESEMPEIAVAYPATFYRDEFNKFGMEESKPPLHGTWRSYSTEMTSSNLLQDVIVYRKST